MTKCFCLFLCALLLALLLPFPGGEAFCAQPAATTKKAKRTATAKRTPTAKKATVAKKGAAVKKGAAAQEQPRLSAAELQAPYSALTGTGAGQQNATRLFFDPTPTEGPFAPAEPDPALKLNIGREQVRDPLTGQELTPRPDPAGAKESLKNRDIKGALDKVGGKAEVQMDLLRF